MARSARDKGNKYAYRFAGAVLFVMATTLLLVLYVFPERYVFDSGFRESGQNVPAPVTPFGLDPTRRVAARPLPEPRPDPEPVVAPAPGPAERLWQDVLPLIGQERYDEAIDRFRAYLANVPGDLSVRRELAVTLLRAERPSDAVDELRRIARSGDDAELRLQLARTLRDLERTEEAASEYRTLIAERPETSLYWLELARTYTWVERYPEAVEILAEALDRHPDAVPLRVELARTRFAMDDATAARRVLAGIPDDALAEVDALELREAVVRATTVPEPEPPPPPTLFEQAIQAREADEFERSEALFDEALTERGDDPEVWQALADLREYELENFEGARSALLEVERLESGDAVDPRTELQLRLARLESWMGMRREARTRLSTLLASLGAGDSVVEAEAHAILGDLARWEGDRPSAADQYAQALAADSTNEQARDGVEELEPATRRAIRAEERPGFSALGRVGADTDEFVRVDVGGQWVRVREDWVFGGSAGRRFIDGLSLVGSPADGRAGVFAELEGSRWWRYGTIRTGVELGLQELADGFDYSIALSVGRRGHDGGRTDLTYEHGPAYLSTFTLQSLIAGVVQDVLRVSHVQPLSERWQLSAGAGISRFRTSLDDLPEARNDDAVRLELSAALSRKVSDTWTLGVSTRILGDTGPAPAITDGLGVERRFYWDPRLYGWLQPFARLDRELTQSWSVSGRLGIGGALIDERSSDGWEAIPQISADVGVRHESDRFSVFLDAFAAQGQFDGYRRYGLSLGLTSYHGVGAGGSR